VLHKKSVIAILAVALVFGVVVTACGDDEGEGTAAGAAGEENIIRFAFSPDPAWNWIVDNGMEEEMETASGIRIIQSITWDEFGVFAGGHADIVSIGSYETPIVESESGVKTVTIGKFNLAKDVVIVANDQPWNTLADLPAGCKVGVESFVGGATIWQAIAKAAHDRDLDEGSSDLTMATADYQVMPDLVAQGDLCAGIIDPTQAIPYLADGLVKTLYNGKAGSELYEEYMVPGTGHQGMTSNNWVTLKSWYDTHPVEVAFFLEVWQVALDEWQANRNDIIDAYPSDFSANTPEQIQWMKDYFVNVFDYFVTNTYLDLEWIKNEEPIVQILKDVGLVAEDNPTPIYVCIDPATGEESCRYPEG
jgi:ABC-type nitrate/sulfonate/bicarbonate transport system substrate-binding protein